jgi:hypothetical protein
MRGFQHLPGVEGVVIGIIVPHPFGYLKKDVPDPVRIIFRGKFRQVVKTGKHPGKGFVKMLDEYFFHDMVSFGLEFV